uniref:Uncharacterized protein n=1 Tax=Anguilla anguilla TaxID=7936 RepID=A0A0E9TL80_ANGAN
MNFCTETVLPMPAIPLVRTDLLMWSSCPGKGWNILLHSILHVLCMSFFGR